METSPDSEDASEDASSESGNSREAAPEKPCQISEKLNGQEGELMTDPIFGETLNVAVSNAEDFSSKEFAFTPPSPKVDDACIGDIGNVNYKAADCEALTVLDEIESGRVNKKQAQSLIGPFSVHSNLKILKILNSVGLSDKSSCVTTPKAGGPIILNEGPRTNNLDGPGILNTDTVSKSPNPRAENRSFNREDSIQVVRYSPIGITIDRSIDSTQFVLSMGKENQLQDNSLAEIGKFREESMKHPLHSSALIVAPKVLADITESLIGAIFFDSNSNIDATWKATKKLLEPLITPETLIIHPVTQLVEICDKWKLKWMYTDTWQDTGEYEFIVENRFFGKAKYSDKKAIAKNRAAFVVYHQILDELGEECDEPNINPECQSHDDEENLKRAEDILRITGYKFLDPNLLQRAFMHYEDNCLSFERFEFLGDAFLNLLIGRKVYFLYPDFDPGKLTPLRAANVDTEKLARVALRHDLHKFLRHDIPLFDTQIAKFREETMEYPLHSTGLMVAPKVLADITESLIGAIYFDSNSCIDATWKVAKKLLKPLITPETLPVHPVSQLMKTCDKRKLSCICNEDSWKNTGEIEYVVGEKFSGKAKYSDKKVIARNRAAFIVYNQILEELDEESCNDQNSL